MSLQLSGTEFEDIRNGFKEFDKDHDGVISVSEFKNCLREGKKDEEDAVDFYMRVYDLNMNGSIEFPEFLEMIAYFRYKKKPNHIQREQMFKALDKDNKGLISGDDIKRFYKIFSSDDLPGELSLHDLVQKLDTNGDGQIDYLEFSRNYQNFEKHAANIHI